MKVPEQWEVVFLLWNNGTLVKAWLIPDITNAHRINLTPMKSSNEPHFLLSMTVLKLKEVVSCFCTWEIEIIAFRLVSKYISGFTAAVVFVMGIQVALLLRWCVRSRNIMHHFKLSMFRRKSMNKEVNSPTDALQIFYKICDGLITWDIVYYRQLVKQE